MSFSKAKRFSNLKVDPTPGPGHYDVNFDYQKRGSIHQRICASPRYPQKCNFEVRKCSLWSKRKYSIHWSSVGLHRYASVEDLSKVGRFPVDENSNYLVNSDQNN